VKWLLDTNVVSETIRRRPNLSVTQWIADRSIDELAISIVAMAEMAEGAASAADENHRRQLLHWFDTTITNWLGQYTLPLTHDILVDWLMLSRQLAAKRIARKAPDLLMAATARVHDLIVVSRNIRGFADTGIVVYDPWNDQTHRMDPP